MLKCRAPHRRPGRRRRFSTLQRVEIAEINRTAIERRSSSVVSVLFNESKLLKSTFATAATARRARFSTLQRVEIAETLAPHYMLIAPQSFSTLQRVEIAEIVLFPPLTLPVVQVSVLFNESKLLKSVEISTDGTTWTGFSTLQRVEIAEMRRSSACVRRDIVSVLFNESKLLKSVGPEYRARRLRVSVLFNESKLLKRDSSRRPAVLVQFQYSSTSRNC